MSPRQGGSLGIYLSDFDPGEFGAEAILRSNFGGYDLGIRGGVIDTGGTAVTIGAEYRNPLTLGTAPIDLAVTAGVQGVFGGADEFGAQAGLSIGNTFVPGSFSLTPYIHPRIGLIDGPGRDEGLDPDLLVELGADLEFRTRIAIRFSANV